MKTGQLSNSGPAAQSGKWPLMTRAHLAIAVVSVALLEKPDETTVSHLVFETTRRIV
jgi:hypothetical protein